MKIETQVLLRALETVKPALASKEIIDQTTSFAFKKNAVVTYNDEICIMHPIPGSKIKGAIEAELLYKYISKIRVKEIEIAFEEEQIILKAGRSKAGFNISSEISLPLSEELTEKGKWKKLPENFLQAINMAKGSCTKDMTDAKLACVHINKKGFVEGCDNHRMFNYQLNKKLPISTTLIPAKCIASIVKLNPTAVAEGKGWLHFKNANDTTISSRIVPEKFVDSTDFLTIKEKGAKLDFPKELKEVLDKAGIFAHRKQSADENVSVTVDKNKLIVKSKSETGQFKETLDIKHKGKSFGFNITPHLLEDIIKETTLCTIYSDRLKFKGKDWVYVTLLRGTTDM